MSTEFPPEAKPLTLNDDFSLLNQGDQSPFSSFLFTNPSHLGNPKEWIRSLPEEHRQDLLSEFKKHRIEFRLRMKELIDVLGVTSAAEIPAAVLDDERMETRKEEANRSFALRYGIHGEKVQIETWIRERSDDANSFISNYLTRDLLEEDRPSLDAAQEVKLANNPIDLIRIIFNPNKFSAQQRFEAERKLFLMDAFAKVEKRRRISKIDDRQKEFQNFLVDHVLHKIPDRTISILSKHNIEGDFSVKNVKELTPEEVRAVRDATRATGEKGVLITTLVQRWFLPEGSETPIPVFETDRIKSPESTVEKMIRTGSLDPALSDEIGARAVVRTRHDADLFLDQIMNGAKNAGVPAEIVEFDEGNKGFTAKLLIVLPGNIRCEIIVSDYKSYLNSEHKDANTSKDGGAHKEYSLQRLKEVYNVMFPAEIYEIRKTDIIENALVRKRAIKRAF
jgi:hypothetical protein